MGYPVEQQRHPPTVGQGQHRDGAHAATVDTQPDLPRLHIDVLTTIRRPVAAPTGQETSSMTARSL
jgi:hypothetical protein